MGGLSTRISLLMPTRGRPALAERFIRSAAERAERADLVEVIVRADEDDPASHALQASGLKLSTIIGPRTSMGAYNTDCLARSNGEIIVLTNDDVVIQTPGWDRALRETHASQRDAIYLAYPNDLFKGKRLCAFPVLSRRTCELLGDPFPRAYQGAFIDYHLLDIFKRLEHAGHLRLFYLEDVVFEHMHFRTGKSQYDDTYRARGRFLDDNVFLMLRGERSRCARRLLQEIDPKRPRAGPEKISSAPRLPRMALAGRIIDFAAAFLADRELPRRWRWFLATWFLGRMLVARGILPGLH